MTAAPHSREPGRAPRPVRSDLWLFAPNRDNQGGSAWFLEHSDRDLLIDVPALTEANLDFLQQRPRPGLIVLTGRDGHGRCRALQEALGWPVLVQEQEAYLLPGVMALETFGREHALTPGLRLLWTPGLGPACCMPLIETEAAGVAAAGISSVGACWCPWRRVAWNPAAVAAASTGPGRSPACRPCGPGCRRMPLTGSPAEPDWGPCGGKPWWGQAKRCWPTWKNRPKCCCCKGSTPSEPGWPQGCLARVPGAQRGGAIAKNLVQWRIFCCRAAQVPIRLARPLPRRSVPGSARLITVPSTAIWRPPNQ